MEITRGIEMLEISSKIMGKTEVVYPVILQDKASVVLIDTGFPNQLSQFHEAFEKAGLSFDMLNNIIITHHDIDHIGSLSDILAKSSTKIKTLTHELEKQFIEGNRQPIKLALLESKLDFLPEQMKTVYQGFKTFYDNLKVTINETVADGEELPFCGGITVIYTPGHTPGHICLYHKKSKTLIAGDTLGVKNGELIATSESINFDQSQYLESLKKLSNLDIESVVCYHGGLYRGSVSQRILELYIKHSFTL